MSTFTTSKSLEQVPRSADVGTWDTPTNSNWAIVDAALGQIVTIGLNNSNVVLNSAQFQCASIVFNSTLTGSVAITFPTSFTGFYSVENVCTGSSAFTITLQTTVAGGQAILCPPISDFEIRNDGTNIKFVGLGQIGTYWDYAGSSVPAWVSGCTVPPYLNCDGTAFSSATYPALANILGGTTLPDSRGRFRAALNQGQGRITSGSSTGGVDGNTILASGGVQTILLSSQNIPSAALTDPGHVHPGPAGGTFFTSPGGSNVAIGSAATFTANSSVTGSATTGITIGSTSPTNFSNIPPAYIGGIVMIRSG